MPNAQSRRMVVARRYAQALAEEAERRSKSRHVDEDMRLILESLNDSSLLGRVFDSPLLDREKKRAVVRRLFGKHVDDLTLRFLEMLIDRQREPLLRAVVQAYDAIRDEHLGIVNAEVRIARLPDDAERRSIEEALGQLTGKRIRCHVQEDPSLLGGLVVRIGDTVYDRSVRRQLERLRARMHARPASTANGAPATETRASA